jgi:hypothetical protein
MVDRLIIYLDDNRGVCSVEQAAQALGVTRQKIKIYCRDTYYVEATKDKLYLRVKGVDPGYEYLDPFKALTIHDFIFSLLCKDYEKSWKNIVSDLRMWSAMTGIDILGTLKNKNIYQTIKKEVKKYREAFLDNS